MGFELEVEVEVEVDDSVDDSESELDLSGFDLLGVPSQPIWKGYSGL